MSNNYEFKRLNFFTGFFTTADDWKDGQTYHIEKRRLHNRLLHRAGVMEGLGVQPDGGLTVRVEKGTALDNEGNLLYLAHDTPIELKPASTPTRFYLTIEYCEKKTDCQYNAQDPDYSGYTRITEIPLIQTVETLAHNHVKLASIYLQPDAKEITAPSNPDQPKENEIDSRDVPKAGAVDSKRDDMLTAARERICQLHRYHQERQRRHNKGLHTPGILCTGAGDLNVVAAGGLYVRVQPGAAIDVDGNHLYLEEPQLVKLTAPDAPGRVYITASYSDNFADYLANFEQPFTGSLNTAKIESTNISPKNTKCIELARIDLEPTTTAIDEPEDSAAPKAGEIDRRARQCSGSCGLVLPRLPPEMQKRIPESMRTMRKNFAGLALKFPGPTVDDVRHVALQIEMTSDMLEPPQLSNRIKVLADVTQDVEHELSMRYPPLATKQQFIAYQDAVKALQASLRNGLTLESLLNCVDAVAGAARNLAQVVFLPPIANAGPDQDSVAAGGVGTVTLDASQSRAQGGQTIVRYRWEKSSKERLWPVDE